MKTLLYSFAILMLFISCDPEPEPETIEVSSSQTEDGEKVQTIQDTTYEAR